MIRTNKVPAEPTLQSQGLREMEEKDVDGVAELVGKYMKRFKMVPEFSIEEIRHNFLSGRGVSEMIDGRREGQVVWAYVVEVGESSNILT